MGKEYFLTNMAVTFCTMPTQHCKLVEYFPKLHKHFLKEWITESKLFKCPEGTGYIFHNMNIRYDITFPWFLLASCTLRQSTTLSSLSLSISIDKGWRSGGRWIPDAPGLHTQKHRLARVMSVGCCLMHGCLSVSLLQSGQMGQPGLRDVSDTPKGPSHICPALSTPVFFVTGGGLGSGESAFSKKVRA